MSEILVPLRRPLVPVSVVASVLDCQEGHIAALLEEGLLSAVNIARRGSSRAELRIPACSLAAYDAAVTAGRKPPPYFAIADLLERILPPARTVRATDLQHILNCGGDLAVHLVKDRSFELVPGAVTRKGPGGSPEFTTASLRKFILNREAL